VIREISALLIDESKWLPLSMCVAGLTVARLLYRQRRSLSESATVLAAMSLFFGATIGTMAFGHLVAVTIKSSLGTLEGSLAMLYPIGVALAIPSWWLAYHAPTVASSPAAAQRAVTLNAWLGGTLLVLGIHNLPLAVPAMLNIGYAWHSRRVVGHALVAVAILLNAGLFVGGLIFMASGQTFEQFRGIE
jgi:hypothetical protein